MAETLNTPLLTIEQATEIVRQHLQTHEPGPARAYIYTWGEQPGLPIGVRVAECGWTTGRSGVCYMQSDPSGLAVCAAVERAIIELLICDDREDHHSEVLGAFWLIDTMITKGVQVHG